MLQEEKRGAQFEHNDPHDSPARPAERVALGVNFPHPTFPTFSGVRHIQHYPNKIFSIYFPKSYELF